MPFLRLTRDRRGIENTFLLHADHAGERPRVLYWYRTAPGIALGRPPLDEEAIHTIEDNHPDIDFDWQAILALSEVMTPEDEVAPARPKRKPRRDRDESSSPRTEPEELPTEASAGAIEPSDPHEADIDQTHPTSGLLEQLVGREIAARLRARYTEIRTLVDERETDPGLREVRLRDAAPLNPDNWATPEAVLDGVSRADRLFEHLRGQLLG